MISEKIVDAIEKEGNEKGFYMLSAGGELDENGEFVFVIRLKNYPPTLGISVQEIIDTKDKPN